MQMAKDYTDVKPRSINYDGRTIPYEEYEEIMKKKKEKEMQDE